MAQPLANDAIDLLVGDDNDLVVTTDFQFARGIDGVAQLCRIAVNTFAGEWFLDLDQGISYFDQILGLPQDVAELAALTEFRRELLATEGVIDIVVLNVSFDGPTRTLTVEWQVSTATGNTPMDSLSTNGSN